MKPVYRGKGFWEWGQFVIEHSVRRADTVGGVHYDEHTWLVLELCEAICFQAPTRRQALEACLERDSDHMASPRERWGTCCPHDPECEHSFIGNEELRRWLDTPISNSEAMRHR